MLQRIGFSFLFLVCLLLVSRDISFFEKLVEYSAGDSFAKTHPIFVLEAVSGVFIASLALLSVVKTWFVKWFLIGLAFHIALNCAALWVDHNMYGQPGRMPAAFGIYSSSFATRVQYWGMVFAAVLTMVALQATFKADEDQTEGAG